MMTYPQFLDEKSREIAHENDCSLVDAKECIDNHRWYRENIEPAMRLGIRPSIAVMKSLVQFCPLSPAQLEREFLSFIGKDDFWPFGYDLKGNKIK